MSSFTGFLNAQDNTQGTKEKKKQADKKPERKTGKHGSYSMDEITVPGKGIKEPVSSLYSMPESAALGTETISKEEIEAIHPQTVYDILEFVPGMEITFQGREHMNFSNMRGMGKFGIILDGVYVLSPDRILATLPVYDIESITVVRDATALTLGPLTNFGNSTGASNQGFVVIKTKRASKLEGGFTASYGSFHTDKENVYQGARIKDFDYRVSYTHRDSLGKTGWYNGYRDQSVLFRGGYTNNMINADVLYFTSRGMREIQRGEIAGGKMDGTLDTTMWRFSPLQSDMIVLNLSKPWTSSQTTALSYSYGNLIINKEASTFIKEVPITSTDQDQRGQILNLRHTVAFDDNTLRVGGQYLDAISPTGLAPMVGRRSSESMYSLYAHDEHRLFNNRLSIDGGVRVDKKYYDNSPVTGSPMHEWGKETYTYALGASFKPHPILTLTGRFAYSENSLASYQLDATTRASLPPERRYRYEGGVLANFHRSFNPSVTLFYYDTKNEKVAAGSIIDKNTGEEIDLVRLSDVRTKGLEIGAYGQFLKYFVYNLNYSYVTTNDHAMNRQMPHNMASARLGYRYKGFETNLMTKWVNGYKQITAAPGLFSYEFGDYTRIDANASYKFKIFDRDTRVMLFGQNLGDVHYATRYVTGAYKDVGRLFGIELSYSFF